MTKIDIEEANVRLAGIINTARLSKKWSIRRLAKETNLSRSTVARATGVEILGNPKNNTYNPSFYTIVSLCKALNISFSGLIKKIS